MSQLVPDQLFPRIYALVRRIPAGHVTSYGQLARLVGTTPRTVGFAMAALPPGADVPWQRVINSQGRVSPRTDGEGNILQRDLLEAEGIQFDDKGKVDLVRFGWTFSAL